MKLVRFGNPGAEKPGLVDQQGGLRDLSGVVADITPENLSRSMLEKLAAISPSKLPLVDGAPRLGVPIAAVGKFVAIGLNYADHAAEANLPLPSEPIVFQKAITSLSGPNDPVVLPKDSTKSDWEVELGIVIGTRASYVERADALAHVAGYCVVNDVSEREYQMERGGTWDKGKGCPAAVAGKPVDIYDFPDGRLEIRWKGLPLPYSVFDHLQRVSHAAIIENKRLGEVLAWIKQQQDKQPLHRGDLVGPRRSNQKAGLMKDRVDRLALGTKSRTRPARLGRRRCDSDVSAASAQAPSEAAE